MEQEHWIKQNLIYYTKICKGSEGEAAISNCAMSMAKILNGLSEMRYTQFHRYEKQIFWNAMKLFSEQCIKQIGYALDCEDVTEKKIVISDIEESISDMSEVFKNIFGGTETVERQVFQSLSVDTNMYELSPKLCALYSSILEKTVRLFGDKNVEYAFVIHPTLHSTIETKVLLRQRKESGKVVLVYISESMIENFEIVSVCLLHEVFHSITRRERNQKKRSLYFASDMVLYMKQFLFQDVKIDMEKEEQNRIEEGLMEYWFSDLMSNKKMASYKEKAEDSKDFAKNRFRDEFVGMLKHHLLKIRDHLDDAIRYVMFDAQACEDYHSYLGRLKMAAGLKDQIRNNINRIILEDKILAAANLLLFMYREIYADMACILALELRPEQYKKAFQGSIQFRYDKASYQDNNREMRELLVARTVVRFLPAACREDWKRYLKELEQGRQANSDGGSFQSDDRNKQNFTIDAGQKDSTCVKMIEAKQVMDNFHAYLTICAEDFTERLRHVNGLREFREEIKRVISNEFSNSLVDILSGKIKPVF